MPTLSSMPECRSTSATTAERDRVVQLIDEMIAEETDACAATGLRRLRNLIIAPPEDAIETAAA